MYIGLNEYNYHVIYYKEYVHLLQFLGNILCIFLYYNEIQG